MRFACDTCHTRYSLADEKVRGRVLKIRCRNCSAVMVVRDPALAPAPDPAPAQQPAPEAAAGWEAQATRTMPVAEAHRLASEAMAGEGTGATWENQATRSIPVAEAMRLARSAGVGAASEPIWYALRQGEQLGPMPREELAARVAAGELGARTYVWREGMADWQRLQAVGELADLLGGGEAEARTRLAPVFDAHTPGPREFAASTPGPAAAVGTAAADAWGGQGASPGIEASAAGPTLDFDEPAANEGDAPGPAAASGLEAPGVATSQGAGTSGESFAPGAETTDGGLARPGEAIPAAGDLDPAALFGTEAPEATPAAIGPHPAAGTFSPRSEGPPPVMAAPPAAGSKARPTLRIVLTAMLLAALVAAAAFFLLPAGAVAPADPPPAAEEVER